MKGSINLLLKINKTTELIIRVGFVESRIVNEKRITDVLDIQKDSMIVFYHLVI